MTTDLPPFEETEVPGPHRIPKTLAETMAFNRNWSEQDRDLIHDEWYRIGVATAYQPPRSQYIVMQDEEGFTIAWVGGGRFEYGPTRVNVAPDRSIEKPDGGRFVKLSTYRDGTERSTGADQATAACSTCNYALPATGICDDCS